MLGVGEPAPRYIRFIGGGPEASLQQCAGGLLMPSIQRPLSGDVLIFELDAERDRTADPATVASHGRAARTLLKEGPMRVTLVVLAPGGELAEHSAEGPITIQPLDGTIRVMAAGQAHEVKEGELLSAAARVRHSVSSDAGAAFLLTVALGDSPAHE